MNGWRTRIKGLNEIRVERDNIYKNVAHIQPRDSLIKYNVCIITKDEK